MQNEQQIPLENGIFALTNINVLQIHEEHIILALTTGNIARLYQLSPKHLKRLSLLINDAVNKYEKDFGKLETELVKAAPEVSEEVGFNTKDLT